MTKGIETEESYFRALTTGTPMVSDGMFFMATPLGPSARINLREMFGRMSREDLTKLKTLVNSELDRKICMELRTSDRGVEL